MAAVMKIGAWILILWVLFFAYTIWFYHLIHLAGNDVKDKCSIMWTIVTLRSTRKSINKRRLTLIISHFGTHSSESKEHTLKVLVRWFLKGWIPHASFAEQFQHMIIIFIQTLTKHFKRLTSCISVCSSCQSVLLPLLFHSAYKTVESTLHRRKS